MSSRGTRSPSPTRSATTVQLPSWVNSLTAGGGGASGSGLSDEQKQRLEQARSYARQLTAKIKRDALEAAKLHQQQLALKNLPIHCRCHVNGVGPNMTERHLKQIFSPLGVVKNVSLPLDPATGKHKGFCYVDYEVPEAVALTFAHMNDVHIDGKNFKIGRPSNYPVDGAKGLPPPHKNRIYVSNVNEQVSEKDISDIFSAFGEVERVAMPPNIMTRKHRGYAYVEFKDPSAAQNAVLAMNGMELTGQPLYVTKSVIGTPMPEGMDSLDKKSKNAAVLPASVLEIANRISQRVTGGGTADGSGKGSAAKPASESPDRTKERPVEVSKHEDRVEETDEMSTDGPETPAKENKQQRHENEDQSSEVSQSDAREKEPEEEPSPPKPAPALMEPSTVVVLRNMIGADEVDDELKEEVEEECTKFGQVDNVKVIIRSSEVEIFVKFGAESGAAQAIKALNGRWFGGRQVQADLYPELLYQHLQ